MIVDVNALAPSICSGGSFYAEVGGGVPANTKYTWNSPAVTGAVTGGSAQSSPQPYIYQTLSYTGVAGSSGIANYTVTPSLDGCLSTPFTFPVTVSLTGGTVPTITNNASIIASPKCSGSAFSFTPSFSTTTGVTYAWKRPSQYGISTAANQQSVPNISEALNDTLITKVDVYYFYTLSYGNNLVVVNVIQHKWYQLQSIQSQK